MTTPPQPDAEPDIQAPTVMPEITYAECRQCGTQIAGLNRRYACGVCGWVNPWSEGYSDLPEPDPHDAELRNRLR
jgi:rubredoxin